jgi:ribosomal protein S18 acetylase RimI-like enzyme
MLGNLATTEIEIRMLGPLDSQALHHHLLCIQKETPFTLLSGQAIAQVGEIRKKLIRFSERDSFRDEVRLGAFVKTLCLESVPKTSKKKLYLAGYLMFKAEQSSQWTEHVASFGLGVEQAFWGKGVGVALMQAMERHAVIHGFRRLEAEVRCANLRALKFYEKLGYAVEGVRKACVRVPASYWSFVDSQAHKSSELTFCADKGKANRNEYESEFYIAKILPG